MSPTTRLRLLPVPPGAQVASVLDPIAEAMAGTGPALVPYPQDGPKPVLPRSRRGLPPGLAFVVTTSGSTGIPKRVLLTGDNLLASAAASYDVLAGPGSWLLALPAHHVAGLQVLVRASLSTGDVTVMDRSGGFTAGAFVAAALQMPGTGDPTYVSLVPTQVARLLADREATAVLAGFDAVLCGGAAAGADLLERAHRAGVRLIQTYGMTETAGGCVYDGLPLPVADVHIDNDRHIVIGGPMVAHGYLGQPDLSADRFHVDADGVRWFRTDDLGRLDDDGRLQVTGRADDLITTGGIKVAPGPVEDALVRFLPGVADAVVLGVPDGQWGESVAAAVVLEPGTHHPVTVADARAALRGVLPDAALPQLLRVLDVIPLLGPGKPDRAALLECFEDSGR